MIPIPYAVDYYVRVTGREPKVVECEACRHGYVYFLKRAGYGQNTSVFFLDNAGAKARAADQAHAGLEAALATGIDPVPCPQCGWYQAEMVAQARAAHWAGLRYVGYFGACLAAGAGGAVVAVGLTGAPADRSLLYTYALAIGLPGLAVWVAAGRLQRRLAAAYDPNAAPAAGRVAVGRSKAMPVEEFVVVLARYEASRKEALAAEEWPG